MIGPIRALAVTGAVALAAALAGSAAAELNPGAWGAAQKADELPGASADINTEFLDGCPIQSPDGLSLYLASNRPGGQGLLDIWVATRERKSDPFGAPQNLGPPVNSAADDFCPTPVGGNGLFFVSRRTTAASCGLGDIYRTRFERRRGWAEPQHLGCAPAGPNTALDEQGPSYVRTGTGGQLYFSSSSATVPGDIYVSDELTGDFGPGRPVAELNSPGNDIQPNVRSDGRELVFSSNHAHAGALGGQDIYAATRVAGGAWSAPANLGSAVNTAAGESRPSLSRSGRTLYFGRAPGPEGMSDIYVTTRAGGTP